MTRFLGVDYGAKRVGIAVSDGLGMTAQPLEVVPRSVAISRIAELAAEYKASTVVVGLPTGLGGEEGSSAAAARALGDEIEASGLDVVYLDERFTSRLAEGVLLESGLKRQDRRDTVDKVAAAIILQSYLDRKANESPESGNSGVV